MYSNILGYVEDIYQVMLSAIMEKKLETFQKELKEMTPLPMNTMLEKQSKTEAIAKKAKRLSMIAVNVPPTNPGCISVCLSQKKVMYAVS